MRISDWSADVCSSDLEGCVALRFQIRGFPRCRAQLASLDRLVSLTELGRWPARNPPPERRAERWALMLRVHDAVASGASHRAIAECLFDLGELPRWRVTAPSWRQIGRASCRERVCPYV